MFSKYNNSNLTLSEKDPISWNISMIHLFGVDEEEDWPKTLIGRQLNSFEDNLRCKLCKEYFSNPQMLPCGHTFCAICLTKRFDKKLNPDASESCPQCRERVETNRIKLNRDLAQVVESFKGIKKDLVKFAEISGEPSMSHEVSESDRELRHPRSKSEKDKNIRGTTITTKIPLRSFHSEPIKTVKLALQNVTKAARGVFINLQGEKDQLEKRYRQFVHLHNSQVDSPTPLSLEEVITFVNKEEESKLVEARKEWKSQQEIENLKQGKASDKVEEGFKNLIKKAKANRKALIPNKNEEMKSKHTKEEHDTHDSTITNEAFSELENSEISVDVWKIVMSKELDRPFFFNLLTQTGQFSIPPDLMIGKSRFIDLSTTEQRRYASMPESKGYKSCLVLPCPNTMDVEETTPSLDFKSINTESALTPACARNSTNESTQSEEEFNRLTSFIQSSPLATNDSDDEIEIIEKLPTQSNSESTTGWSCWQCTYMNEISLRECEICSASNTNVPVKLAVSQNRSGSESQTSNISRIISKRGFSQTLDKFGISKSKRSKS